VFGKTGARLGDVDADGAENIVGTARDEYSPPLKP
jgi:hypothetical protein